MDLRCALDRFFTPEDTLCQRHLLLSLTPPAQGSTRLPLNLALVIDRSGSMAGEKIVRAREAASLAVRHLASVDRLAVVAYDSEVALLAPSTPLDAAARARCLQAIAMLQPGSSTFLSGGWLAGCEQVALHQRENALNRVLLLTDGLANVGITDPGELAAHARNLRERGVQTSTMGIGADFNELLLAELARAGGGRFQYVASAAAIPDCVQGELGELLQVAARAAAVEIDLPAGVRLDACLSDISVESTARGVRLRLGDLIGGQERLVLLRLRVEPAAAGTARPLAARVLYTGLDGRGHDQAFPSLALTAADAAACAEQAPDPWVEEQVQLHLLAQAREEAAQHTREGDLAAASSRMRQALHDLQAPASSLVAQDFAEFADETRAAEQGAVDPKELHYKSWLRRTSRRRYDR